MRRSVFFSTFLMLLFMMLLLPTYALSELDTKLDLLTTQIITNMTQNNKTTIAVIEFSDIEGSITVLGKYIAEELTTRLFITKKFEVVERELLYKVLKEYKLNLSGLVDASSAKELGKILGVTAIVTGTITDLGKSVKINSRLISTENGSLFAVAAVEVTKDETVKSLLEKIVSAQSPEISTPELTVASTFTPVPSPTPVPATATPSPDPTPAPASASIETSNLSPETPENTFDMADKTLVKTVLKAISGKKPDFEDDFSSSSSGWEVGVKREKYHQGEFGYDYANQEYFMTAFPRKNNCSSGKVKDFSDFAAEIDGRFITRDRGRWEFKFRTVAPNNADFHCYAVGVSQNRTLSIYRLDKQNNVNKDTVFFKEAVASLKTGLETNHLTVIAKGPQIAVLVNGELAVVVTDPNFTKSPLKKGGFQLWIGNEGDTPMRVQWDNLKIWDISKVSTVPTPVSNLNLPPDAQDFVEPILAAIAAKKPTLSDDFRSGWSVGIRKDGHDGEMGFDYVTGEYFITALPDQINQSFSSSPTDYSDFVAEIDGRFVSGDNECWDFKFRSNGQNNGFSEYAVSIFQNGKLRVGHNGERNKVRTDYTLFENNVPSLQTGLKTNHLKVIVKDSRIAVFINGQLAAFVTDPNYANLLFKKGKFPLWIGNRNNSTPLRVHFSNLKVWDISKLKLP
jgi:TolB-like protein